MHLSYFNPNSQKECDFLKAFVARQRTLDFFLQQLRLAPAEGSAQHHLIIAPRGFGKTSLLRRIAIGVEDDQQLRTKFIALRFREEQHNVISLDIFWRNCIQSLTEAREDESATENEIAGLEAAWAKYAPRQVLSQEAQDGEPAWEALHAHCVGLGRRPLLLIDNLDTLLAGLSATHQWKLRKCLQSDDGPILIAAASRYPAATHDQAAAFYEFFRVQPLAKLTDSEVFACLRNIAANRGPAGHTVSALLEKDPGRVAALNAMAGGNPRTLSVLYDVLESGMSSDILSQLNAMLDTFTGWYQARAEELPIQARAVFDALALNWDPMTAADLGRTTGLDTPIVSSQLSRLEKAGYVDTVALSSRRKGRSGYEVSERFFNIWYLMRNGPRRARQSIFFLTKFLQSCFSLAERHQHAVLVLENDQADPAYALALASSFTEGVLREQLLEKAHSRLHGGGQTGDYVPLINELRADEQRPPVSSPRNATGNDDRERAASMFLDAVKLGSAGQSEQAIAAYQEVVTQFGNAAELPLRELVGKALLNQAARFTSLGQAERAIAAYDNLIERLQDGAELRMRELVAKALLAKAGKLSGMGQSARAIAAYDDVVTRFASAAEASLREHVANALFLKATRLWAGGRAEQAIAVSDEVIARFGTATEPSLREKVAKTLFSKGAWLGASGQSRQAIAVYDDLETRFSDASEAFQEVIAKALVNKGVRLGALDEAKSAIATYDQVITRFGAASSLALREQVAKASFNKGYRLAAMGLTTEAIAAYDEVIVRFLNASETTLREQSSKALINKGVRLGILGKAAQSLATYDEVIDHFGASTEPVLCVQVAKALLNKGVSLKESGHFQQAIAAYDDIVARYGGKAELTLRERVSHALEYKARTLADADEPERAVAVYENIISRFSTADEASLRARVSLAFHEKAYLQCKLERLDASESTYREAIAWDPAIPGFHAGLGLLFLDFIGNAQNALMAFERGLDVASDPPDRVLLHANIAYAIALHGGVPATARMHASKALEDGTSTTPAGQHLLKALPIWSSDLAPDWSSTFIHIGQALACEDPALWSDHGDDLERVLWYVLTKNQGAEFKSWMETAQFPQKYAPLYHAFVAALEGEDHLLHINPETRHPTRQIYAGITRRVKLWPTA